MTERELLDLYLRTLSPKVNKNVVINDTKQPLYHISFNGDIKSFVPFIGHRQSNSEDRTVPRVCVGSDLLGCLMGFADLFSCFVTITPDGKSASKFKGGWKIYTFDYDYALKPNKQMCGDAEITGEQWLVAYSAKSRQYKPRVIGEVVCKQIIITPVNKQLPDKTHVFYLKVDESFWIDSKNEVVAGCYEVAVTNIMDITDRNVDLKEFIKPIDISEYTKVKGQVAELLDLPSKPPYLNW